MDRERKEDLRAKTKELLKRSGELDKWNKQFLDSRLEKPKSVEEESGDPAPDSPTGD